MDSESIRMQGYKLRFSDLQNLSLWLQPNGASPHSHRKLYSLERGKGQELQASVNYSEPLNSRNMREINWVTAC